MKTVAVALLAVAALLLTALAVGEMASGDVAGVQHIPEALALMVLAAAGWRYPGAVSAVLLVATAVLLLAWLVFALTTDGHDSTATLALVAAVLFLPPIVAAWLLYEAGIDPSSKPPTGSDA